MKVFVTGGTGLVGSFVVNELLAHRYQPVLLVRDASTISTIFPQCELIEGDILDTVSLRKGMEQCEVVIHCAGKVSFDPRKEEEIYQVNVIGTTNVVNACIVSGIKKLIHVSSIAALGRQATKTELSESSEWVDSTLNSTYAKSKYQAELEVFRGGEEGLDFSIVNPSIVLGRGNLERSSTRLFHQISKLPQFYPNGYLNVVDVRDVARTIVSLIQIKHQNRLILNWGEISYRDLYQLIRKERSIKGLFIPVSKNVLTIIAFFSGIKSAIGGGEPLVTRENLRFLNKKFTYNSTFYTTLYPHVSLIPVNESVVWALKGLYTEK